MAIDSLTEAVSRALSDGIEETLVKLSGDIAGFRKFGVAEVNYFSCDSGSWEGLEGL